MKTNNDDFIGPVVDYLFHDQPALSLDYSQWARLIWTILVWSDADYSQKFFDQLSAKIENDCQNTDFNKEQKNTRLYTALSYVAYVAPVEGACLKINSIEYSIHKIPLTSRWISSTYYAYGLTSADGQAQPYLIFPGTTTPSDNGFLAGILADTMPGGAIGALLYTRGQSALQTWITKQASVSGQRVMCTGQSLGGAMCLHAYINQPELVSYNALNPPSLTPREEQILSKAPQLDVDFLLYGPADKIVITHRADPVRSLGKGFWPTDTMFWRHGAANENSAISHARGADVLKFACDSEPLCIEPLKQDDLANDTSYLWILIIKPLLFILACAITAVLWPIRLGVELFRPLFETSHTASTELDYSLASN